VIAFVRHVIACCYVFLCYFVLVKIKSAKVYAVYAATTEDLEDASSDYEVLL
jgi:hypothetical protein